MSRQLQIHSPHNDRALPDIFLAALRRSHPHLFTSLVRVTNYDSTTEIVGTVSNYFHKQQIQELLKRLDPAKVIINQLIVPHGATNHSRELNRGTSESQVSIS